MKVMPSHRHGPDTLELKADNKGSVHGGLFSWA